MYCKKPKKIKHVKEKSENLPSFLLKLTPPPAEITLPSKLTKTEVYSGPLFFDGCDKLRHPQHHSSQFNTFDSAQPIIQPTEYVNDLFLSPPDAPPKVQPKFSLHFHKKKAPAPLVDEHPHGCPGTRKMFRFEVVPRVVAFGRTKSTLETEICEEIPLYVYKRSKLCFRKMDEIMELFAMKNRDRKLMTPEERAAHLHLPKRFRTVELVGPRIPASFIITKIPSKRRQFFEWGYGSSFTAFRKTSKKSIQEGKKSVSCSKSGSGSQGKPDARRSSSLKKVDSMKVAAKASSVVFAPAKSKSRKDDMGRRAKLMGKKGKTLMNKPSKRSLLSRALSKSRVSTVTFKEEEMEKKKDYLADTTKKKFRLESN